VSRATTNFVVLVKVILSAPLKVKVTSVQDAPKEVQSTAAEVAKALPVATLDVPKVPEWA
jgi:hypothetical protein